MSEHKNFPFWLSVNEAKSIKRLYDRNWKYLSKATRESDQAHLRNVEARLLKAFGGQTGPAEHPVRVTEVADSAAGERVAPRANSFEDRYHREALQNALLRRELLHADRLLDKIMQRPESPQAFTLLQELNQAIKDTQREVGSVAPDAPAWESQREANLRCLLDRLYDAALDSQANPANWETWMGSEIMTAVRKELGR